MEYYGGEFTTNVVPFIYEECRIRTCLDYSPKELEKQIPCI
jgi:hypothetical protein